MSGGGGTEVVLCVFALGGVVASKSTGVIILLRCLMVNTMISMAKTINPMKKAAGHGQELGAVGILGLVMISRNMAVRGLFKQENCIARTPHTGPSLPLTVTSPAPEICELHNIVQTPRGRPSCFFTPNYDARR